MNALFLEESELERILVNSAIPSGSRRILDNVMDFAGSTASDVMTSRGLIFSVSIHQPLKKTIEKIIQSGLSRVPVYSGSWDNILGILYSKDLLLAWRSGTLFVLEDLLRPVHYVRMDTPLPDLLREFRRGHHHVAMVTDTGQRRPIRGLVTIQDALEAIVGDIREEL